MRKAGAAKLFVQSVTRRQSTTKHLAFLVFAAVTTPGCATLFNSEVKAVGMYSSPMEAEVWVNGTMRGETPLSVELDNQESHTVVFKKEGHSDVACDLRSEFEGRWVLVDVVPGALVVYVIPLVVDLVTGGWRGISEDACNAVLPAIPASAETKSSPTETSSTNKIPSGVQ